MAATIEYKSDDYVNVTDIVLVKTLDSMSILLLTDQGKFLRPDVSYTVVNNPPYKRISSLKAMDVLVKYQGELLPVYNVYDMFPNKEVNITKYSVDGVQDLIDKLEIQLDIMTKYNQEMKRYVDRNTIRNTFSLIYYYNNEIYETNTLYVIKSYRGRDILTYKHVVNLTGLNGTKETETIYYVEIDINKTHEANNNNSTAKYRLISGSDIINKDTLSISNRVHDVDSATAISEVEINSYIDYIEVLRELKS